MANPAQTLGSIPSLVSHPASGNTNYGTGTTPQTFNGHQVTLPQDHPAQGRPQSPFDGENVPEPYGQRRIHTDTVRNVDPTVSIQGSPEAHRPQQPPSASDTEDSQPLDNEALKKLSDQELLEKGDKQLEAAKEAYTKYGRNKLAHDAKEAIRPFINCAEGCKDPSKLFGALKQIKLPEAVSKDIAITIKFPGPNTETISLIPPGEALKSASTKEVVDWYRLAFQAMYFQVNELNSGDENALARAEYALNDVVATLKAIRKEIDTRRLKDNEPDKWPGSKLEEQYHEFTEKGVTVSHIAKADLLQHPLETESKGKIPDPTKKPGGRTYPAPTDGTTTTNESMAPAESNTTTAPAPGPARSGSSAPVAAPGGGDNTQMPPQPD